MLVLWIILILLFSFVMLFLLAPLRLCIDSSKNIYHISFSGVASFAFIPGEEDWFFELKIGFWKKKFLVSSFAERIKKSEAKKEQPKSKTKQKRFDFFKSLKIVRRILRSFKVKICKIDIDTDDYYWNALLIPAFQLLNRGKQHRIAINFEGKNQVVLLIENRPIDIVYSILFRK